MTFSCTDPDDFTALDMILTFDPNTNRQEVTVAIADDAIVEPDQDFTSRLQLDQPDSRRITQCNTRKWQGGVGWGEEGRGEGRREKRGEEGGGRGRREGGGRGRGEEGGGGERRGGGK